MTIVTPRGDFAVSIAEPSPRQHAGATPKPNIGASVQRGGITSNLFVMRPRTSVIAVLHGRSSAIGSASSSASKTSARPHNRIMKDSFRIERDTMGDMQVPASALYGPQTARAVQNFPISGKRSPRSFIRAVGIIKSAAATTNGRMGHLQPALAAAIEAAAEQVVEGRYDNEFPIDIFQTGSGTSYEHERQ